MTQAESDSEEQESESDSLDAPESVENHSETLTQAESDLEEQESKSDSLDAPESVGPSQRKQEFTLEEVRQRIQRAQCRELPKVVPFPVHEYYIKQCLSQWYKSSETCFEESRNILQEYVSTAVKKHFQHLPELYSKARYYVV